jgi:hypothetical protein
MWYCVNHSAAAHFAVIHGVGVASGVLVSYASASSLKLEATAEAGKADVMLCYAMFMLLQVVGGWRQEHRRRLVRAASRT